MSLMSTMEAVKKCAITPVVASTAAVRWVTSLIAVEWYVNNAVVFTGFFTGNSKGLYQVHTLYDYMFTFDCISHLALSGLCL